ncbi:RNA polymerase sigma factor [Echinicola sediminis]
MYPHFHHFTDEHIWFLVKESDEAAFTFIYEKYADDLFRYGQRISSDFDLIEDAVQDVFISLWQNRHKIAISDSVKFYILKSFKRELLLKIKKKGKFKIIPENNFCQTVGESHQEQLIQKETQEGNLALLDLSMKDLTNRQREALHLRYIENLSYQEISAIMGIEVSTIYNVIFRAIKELKRDFQKHRSKFLLFALIFLLGSLL